MDLSYYLCFWFNLLLSLLTSTWITYNQYLFLKDPKMSWSFPTIQECYGMRVVLILQVIVFIAATSKVVKFFIQIILFLENIKILKKIHKINYMRLFSTNFSSLLQVYTNWVDTNFYQ